MDTTENKQQLTAGGILILLGLAFLGMQFLRGIGPSIILFLVGCVFVAAYVAKRSYGLLIPGGILMGLGLGSLADSLVGNLIDFGGLGLGLGFVAIYVIDLVYQGKTHWWPLIPGGILIFSVLASSFARLGRLLSIGWPIVLVAVGLFLLFKAIKSK